eukprot:2325101-Amphidinium_carterae.1
MEVEGSATRTPHPDGSQRSVVFAFIIDALLKHTPADHALRGTLDTLTIHTAAEIDACIFRLQPKFDAPQAGKPW